MPVLFPLIAVVGKQIIQTVEFCEYQFFMEFLKDFVNTAAEECLYPLTTIRKFYAVNISQLILLRAVFIGLKFTMRIYRHCFSFSGRVINGPKIVTTSPSFPQCVERESRGLKTQTGCPIENLGHDRQIEMIFQLRLLQKF